MPGRKNAVRITANFERNLAEIRDYLAERDAASAFDALVGELLDKVIPNLESFPEIGRDFLARLPASVEGQALRERVVRLAGRIVLREYIAGDYLILYGLSDGRVALLSIKHHLQLSFDLKGHWK